MIMQLLCAISGWHRNIATEFVADSLVAVTIRIRTPKRHRTRMQHDQGKAFQEVAPYTNTPVGISAECHQYDPWIARF